MTHKLLREKTIEKIELVLGMFADNFLTENDTRDEIDKILNEYFHHNE